MTPDAYAVLQDLAPEHMEDDGWAGARFEFVKRLSSTATGAIGEDFVHALCGETGLSRELPEDPGEGRGRESWDIRIEGRTFEIKTATLGVSGTFQFNNIRTRRTYDALLVIAITPTDVFMRVWTRRDIVRDRVDGLVPMARDAPALLKLTKREPDLLPIDRFEEAVRDVIKELDMGAANPLGPRPAPGSPGAPL